MEVLFNVVGGFVVEVGKNVCKCVYPKIENTLCFSSKIENLRKEMEKLTEYKDDIKEKVEVAEREGYKPKPRVIEWIEDVHELKNEWETTQESIAAAKMLAYKCCPKFILRSEVSSQLERNIRDRLYWLKEVGEKFGSNLVVENYQMKKVEFIPGPSIEGQLAATQNLNKILKLLEDDKVRIIGLLGLGGVGKTTLVKNLNNELLKTDVPSSKLSFGVVVWVTVPKPIDIRNVQAQIASRLNLNVDNKGSVESIASKIYERLKQEKSFLLILDDAWEAIDLDHVGVPQPKDHPRSKVIITSRSLEVCRKMKTRRDTELYVTKLEEDESWQLFVTTVGADANLEHIQPLAKEIARECGGLPLAITVIGTSMRGKTRVELWKDALKSLRMSEPHNKDVKDKVYKVIKWSFDSLESPDIELSSEQRSKHVNEKRGDIQGCFLYCSLYPMAISTDELICCLWAEGFLGEHSTYEEAYNRGITMVESLKDACLLEAHKMDSVKMHDVVRDVAIWIANSSGDKHHSVIQAGIGLRETSQIKTSASLKRISLVSNKIKCLPDNFIECPQTTTLLLQDNDGLWEIAHKFCFAFPSLRVLNLSQTGIRALPSSINSLCQLRALILQNCRCLKELPPIGDLCNLLLLDCANTRLHCVPQGMDKLTDLKLLMLPGTDLKCISKGTLLKLSSIEMINMLDDQQFSRNFLLGATSFDEISSLQNLTSLFIRLDSSSILNRDHTWMTRLKRFRIEVGDYPMRVKFNKSARMICLHKCENFSKGELSGMLQFSSDLYLEYCKGLRKLIENKSFNGLKSLYISGCYCDFKPAEGGCAQIDPLPNLEYLNLCMIDNLTSVSDFGHLLSLRFSKLRKLYVSNCQNLKCLFNLGGFCSVPEHLEEIKIFSCNLLVEIFMQSQTTTTTTIVNSEIPRVRELCLEYLPELTTLDDPHKKYTWEHLEELSLIYCDRIRKLPLSIQTSNNIKLIRGQSKWWCQLEWDAENFKSNLDRYFLPGYYRIKDEVAPTLLQKWLRRNSLPVDVSTRQAKFHQVQKKERSEEAPFDRARRISAMHTLVR